MPVRFWLWLFAAVLPFANCHAGETSKLADLMPGTWHGVFPGGGTAYQHCIRIQRGGAGFVGQGISWCGLSEEQAMAAMRGQKPGRRSRARCA
jgi:hypothetical protein